ncbi:MAG TPA: ABC transporter permease subunit [Rhodospirillales bacterium]
MSGRRRRWAGPGAGFLVPALPYAWLALFLVLPLVVVFRISLSEPVLATPPYTPLLGADPAGGVRWLGSLKNYAFLIGDPLYIKAYLNSLRIAATATLVCLLIGYPMAYAIVRAPESWRVALVMLIVLPFWTSFLIRVYAWIGLLKANGLINNALIALGLIETPLPLLYNEFAVHLGIVYSYLPFMVLPLFATLARMDWRLVEAASDLGCRPFRAFLAVTLPLSLPGVAAGTLLVFIPAVGEFVIPDLLGGSGTLMIGKVLWTEFFANRDWPLASAAALAMLALLVLPIALLGRARGAQDRRGD